MTKENITKSCLPLFISLLMLASAMISCGNLDDFPELATVGNADDSAQEQELKEQEVAVDLNDTIKINETALTGEVEYVPSAVTGEEGYKDFVDNFLYDDDTQTWDDGVKSLEITFADDGVTYVYKNKNGKVKSLDTSTLSVTTDGAHVTVHAYKKMKFVLSGSTANGSFKIYSDKKFIVQLNGVNITNPTGAAINCQKGDDGGKRCFLVVADGTSNYLADGTAYNTTEGEDEKGTFFSEGKVLVSGGGYLNIRSNAKHGLACDDYIYLHAGPQLTITPAAGYDGLKTNDGVYIAGGVMNITCSGVAAKGINTAGMLMISGGRTTVVYKESDEVGESGSTDGDAVAGLSCCVKCDSVFSQSAGALLLSASSAGGNGINVAQSLTMTGGTMVVVASGTPLTYGSLCREGGKIYVNNEEYSF